MNPIEAAWHILKGFSDPPGYTRCHKCGNRISEMESDALGGICGECADADEGGAPAPMPTTPPPPPPGGGHPQ